MANIEEINDDNFKNSIQKNDIVIVDFNAPWCGPCRKLSPILEQVQNEFINEVKIYKIDTDKNPISAQEYGIISLPTVLFFKTGEVKEIMVGMLTKSSIVELTYLSNFLRRLRN